MPTRPSRRRGTLPPRPSAPRTAGAVQLALFTDVVDVRPLDPRTVAGPRTRVRGAWLVRYPHASRADRGSAAHRVLADRHGWYCEEHGPTCRAVGDAWAAAGAPALDAP